MEIAAVSHIAMQWPHRIQSSTLSAWNKISFSSFLVRIAAGQMVMHNSQPVQRERFILCDVMGFCSVLVVIGLTFGNKCTNYLSPTQFIGLTCNKNPWSVFHSIPVGPLSFFYYAFYKYYVPMGQIEIVTKTFACARNHSIHTFRRDVIFVGSINIISLWDKSK